jgi:hypothetical protein
MAVVELSLLAFWVTRQSGARVLRALSRPLGVAVVAGGTGLALTQVGGDPIVMGVAGLLAAELLLLAGLRLLARDDLRAAMRITRSAVASERAA